MAEVLLFHHAQGLTTGCLAFAGELRAAGHVVHTPDLYEGRIFAELSDGVDYAKAVGFETIVERGVRAAARLPSEVAYAGFSLGVLPAQMLAQTRPGATGALFLHSCASPAEFGCPWPAGLPLQIHTMDGDAWGDLDVARAVAAAVGSATLFLYPGTGHLFTDNSLPDYDEATAARVMRRVLSFLDDVG